MKPAFLILMLAAAVAATIIGGLADATDAQIQRNQADYDLKILQRVIKDPALTLIKTDPDSEHFELWSATRRQGFLLAIQTALGYNGTIRAWLAVDETGSIIAVSTRSHQETPGIGDIINSDASWLDQLDHRNLLHHRFRLKRDGGDFDHVTGATITSRAYIEMVDQGFKDHAHRFIAGDPDERR
jgi:RnfABCDGE-type electron transport complex G subunit